MNLLMKHDDKGPRWFPIRLHKNVRVTTKIESLGFDQGRSLVLPMLLRRANFLTTHVKHLQTLRREDVQVMVRLLDPSA